VLAANLGQMRRDDMVGVDSTSGLEQVTQAGQRPVVAEGTRLEPPGEPAQLLAVAPRADGFDPPLKKRPQPSRGLVRRRAVALEAATDCLDRLGASLDGGQLVVAAEQFAV